MEGTISNIGRSADGDDGGTIVMLALLPIAEDLHTDYVSHDMGDSGLSTYQYFTGTELWDVLPIFTAGKGCIISVLLYLLLARPFADLQMGA